MAFQPRNGTGRLTGRGAVIGEQHASEQARVPAIAVREAMDGDEPVMKACGGFVKRACRVLQPVPRVIQRLIGTAGGREPRVRVA